MPRIFRDKGRLRAPGEMNGIKRNFMRFVLRMAAFTCPVKANGCLSSAAFAAFPGIFSLSLLTPE
jgi:hypothetical protein